MGLALRKECDSDPFYHICAKAGHHGHVCKGKITWEHALIFAVSKVQKKFAIVPICEYGHGVNFHLDSPDLDKDFNVWISLSLSTPEEIQSISKAVNYTQKLKWLKTIYGEYDKQKAFDAFEILKAERGYMRDGILYIGERKTVNASPAKVGPKLPSNTPSQRSQNRSGEKKDKFWYPLSSRERGAIEKAIEWHKEVLDEHYTPFQMIEKAILSYHKEVIVVDSELEPSLEINY